MFGEIFTVERRIHDRIIYELSALIYKNISRRVNYDAKEFIVKKSDIPLIFKDKKYDISFEFEDHLIFIEIKTISKHKHKL